MCSRLPNVYQRQEGGGTSSKVYMKLGKESEIRERYGCADAEAWARQKLREVNEAYKVGYGVL